MTWILIDDESFILLLTSAPFVKVNTVTTGLHHLVSVSGVGITMSYNQRVILVWHIRTTSLLFMVYAHWGIVSQSVYTPVCLRKLLITWLSMFHFCCCFVIKPSPIFQGTNTWFHKGLYKELIVVREERIKVFIIKFIWDDFYIPNPVSIHKAKGIKAVR